MDSLSFTEPNLVAVPVGVLLSCTIFTHATLFFEGTDELDLSIFLCVDGIARASSSMFNELRSAVFAKVSQQGIRNVACETLRNLHRLDLQFHVNRNTGALSRAIDRGTR